MNIPILFILLTVLALVGCKIPARKEAENREQAEKIVSDYRNRNALIHLVLEKNRAGDENWIYVPAGLSFGNKKLPELDKRLKENPAGKTVQVRLVFPDSTTATNLSSRHFKIMTGRVTFRTPAGTLSFLPDGEIRSKVNSESSEVKARFKFNTADPSYSQTFQNVIVGFRTPEGESRRAYLSMNLVGLEDRASVSYAGLLHALPVENRKGGGVVDLKIEFSPDFKGSVENWFLLPNWN